MTYFNSRELAAIALCASLWGVLNSIFSPTFFRLTGMPFLCDLIGFFVLALAASWVRKFGAITAIGVIATAINFVFVPGAFQFLGFLAASAFFDLVAAMLRNRISLTRISHTFVVLVLISTASAALAGYLIGLFFMTGPALVTWGGALGWAGLHSIGGVIGGGTGAFLIVTLHSRKVLNHESSSAIKRWRGSR